MDFGVFESHGSSSEETMRALQEDRKAMAELLYEEGLLLDSTLDRIVRPKDSVKVYKDLISKSMRSPHRDHGYITFAHDSMEHIKKLSTMPDGLLTAMNLLIKAATGFVEDYNRETTDLDCWDGAEDVLWPMGDLMAEFIRTMYFETRTSKEHWDYRRLMKRIEELRDNEISRVVDMNSDEGLKGLDMPFEESINLLHVVVSLDTASVLANKVVGHRLPAELSEMVKGFICSDDALTKEGEQAQWRDD
ncbi:hypothetical protein LTR37_014733 [Vermiconidia calcicola]|uniref:Uncharacterized protein n=1 Tax=Vermiconidia calcicola TaxID=1690605 RepID=A0ACC3MSQ0_9PEZI|nr:hypothetical protein LTR37_014733 [Vermiconidia calcicola]